MNILITSAGRRTSLLRAFAKAVEGSGGAVLAGDMDPLAPALYFASKSVHLPRVTDECYLKVLQDAVDKYGIRLIVPTIDTELPILSNVRAAFGKLGCEILISSAKCISVMRDKWLFVNMFSKYGVRVPLSWIPDQLENEIDGLPDHLFIKPRTGSASAHTYRVDKGDLGKMIPLVPNVIIQEHIAYPEITVDALIDLNGVVIHFVPRRRIKTVGGESVQGVTIADPGLEVWLLKVLQIVSELGGRGPMTLQAFLSPEGPVLSEINPRFGGGFPLALAAGGLYPQWILRMLDGETVEPRIGDYRVNLYMTRYYSEVIIKEPLWGDE